MSNESKNNFTELGNDSAEAKGNSNVSLKDSLPEATNSLSKGDEHKLANNVAGRTRFVATVPATGLLIASVVMAIGTIVSLVISTFYFVIGEIDLHGLIIEFIEYADAFLLAVALYILSIGLVSLFISKNIPLPTWLEFHDFDDLKERLMSVIIVMIGVSFLGHVLKGPQGIDTLWLGLGCTAIIIGLSVYMRTASKPEK